MKRTLVSLTLCLFAFCGISFLHAQSFFYDRYWKQVEKAEKQVLPQTVVKLTDEIFRKAEAEKNSPQMLKAYTWRTKFQEKLMPDSFYMHLVGWEHWVNTTPNPLDRAVLHSLVAEIYADYAGNNLWKLRRSTAINDKPFADIREWDADMFVQKVLEHTRAALKDSLLLLNTSSKAYTPFAKTGETSGYYNHDMYHLLALRGTKALERIVSLSGKDSLITTEVSIIFHHTIDTYRRKNNTDAMLLATIDSLIWNGRNDVSESLLDKLIIENNAREICAEVYLIKAQQLFRKNNYADALRICDEALAKYPKYKRINALKNLKQEILNPALSVNTNNLAYPETELALQVNHRNLSGFTVEYYKVSLPVISPELKNQPAESFYKKQGKKIDSQHLSLIRSNDYSFQDTVIPLKAPQEGVYLMRMVPDDKAKTVIENFLYVTRFKTITRALPDNQCEIAVLDAESGKPVSGAMVCLFTEKKGEYQKIKILAVDKNGKVRFPQQKEYQYFTAETNEDTALPLQNIYKGRYNFSDNNEVRKRITLLTDRKIYRPGQIVYVKGIAYNLQADTANVIAGKDYTLALTDANRRMIREKEVYTNEFGSFTAEFVLPSGSLNGEYELKTEGGSTLFRVEEYKRPAFDIVFAAQEETFQWGDSLRVKGTVKTYNGVPVQHVPVRYTVTRQSYTGLRKLFTNNETLLTSGSVMPDETGQFTIPLWLEKTKPEEDKNSFFVYKVEATVTDVAGETQTSTTSIKVGRHFLLLSAKISKLICKEQPGTAVFSVVNLTDTPVNREGIYKLFPIIDAEKCVTASDPVYSGAFVSNRETSLSAWQSLPSGEYKLTLSVRDTQERESGYEQEITLFSMNDTRPSVETKVWYYPVNTKFNTLHPASFLFGTSERDTYVFMDVFNGNRHLDSKVLLISDSIMRFDYPYKKEYGGGLTVSFCFVKKGKLYQQQVSLEKRVPEKELKITREVFRDKLSPGRKEEWKLIVKTPQGLPAVAEMLATLYDASLDKIWKNNQTLEAYYGFRLPFVNWTTGYVRNNYYSFWFPYTYLKTPEQVYDMLQANPSGYNNKAIIAGYGGLPKVTRALSSAMMKETNEITETETIADTFDANSQGEVTGLRTNFAETALFYPQLHTNEQGEIVFSFTVPESLTRWNFRGYAHTKGMLTGMVDGETVTMKDFMLVANLPRFVRVGDKTSMAATVTNLTNKNLTGTVTFTLFDPVTEKIIAVQKQVFHTETEKTTGINFSFHADDKRNLLGCRIIAQSGEFSDGEQHLLPVLSNQERIVETIAMPVRGKEKREFSLQSLYNANSKTAVNRRLTIEFSGNPAWYALQALPILSLPVEDNAISLAAAYYANALAASVVNANPRIKTVFDSWKLQGGTEDTFLGNLQKNQEIKTILIEESPWLTEAADETEQIRRIAILFDLNRIQNKNLTALTKLRELQHTDGSWSWYKGMQGSRYITEFVAKTLVRLSILTGNSLDNEARLMLQAAFVFLHKEAVKEYQNRLQEEKKGRKHTGISAETLQYLYLIALSEEKIPAGDTQKAYSYFLGKVSESLASQSLNEKALSAVVLHKAGRINEAKAFIASLKEHAVQTDEQGMHFAFNETPYAWREMKVPIHVSVMEAFDLTGDGQSVEEMKLWLLKQKQTQQWDSPIATVDAVYALLQRGSGLLENKGDVQIVMGEKVMETLSANKTTGVALGYLKETLTDSDLLNRTKKIIVEKRDAGIAWGAVYAQYNENNDKVTRHGKELQVEKKLYVERITNNNEKQLHPVTSNTTLAVGDKVISRITIRLDRPMDFVQLKDQCGACFEPVEALSGYRWSNGTGYYAAVKDASTNFFFDSLDKGVYVLEFAYRVSRVGIYQTGLATIQPAYAPEYAGHSGGMKIEVEARHTLSPIR
ncbi:hypothetical protein EZS27_002091 [termite gut metagenome]|uniref:Alpha-2-macroglobulin domain-containing protein n=1 Tax=termite gut metagenome TaxID=433724 RepID=A0A5J4SWN5_9ZZZZ